MTHQVKEIGPHPVQFIQRRQVLDGNYDGFDFALFRVYGRRANQGGHGTAIGQGDGHFLGAYRLPAEQDPAQGYFAQGYFPPVGPPVGQGLQRFLPAAARCAHLTQDSFRFPVAGHELTGPGIENKDPDGGDLNQGLQVRLGAEGWSCLMALFMATAAWAAKAEIITSSSGVNSGAVTLSARYRLACRRPW